MQRRKTVDSRLHSCEGQPKADTRQFAIEGASLEYPVALKVRRGHVSVANLQEVHKNPGGCIDPQLRHDSRPGVH